MRGEASVRVWTVMGISVANMLALFLRRWGMKNATYGPSVQVKTCGKPHERTSASDSRCDFAGIVVVVWCAVC